MKFILLTALIFCIYNFSFGQYYTPELARKETKKGIFSNWKDKIYFGGNGGIGLARNYTYIEVAPLIGYNLHPKFSIGTTLSYTYLNMLLGYRYNNTLYVFPYRSHLVGVSPFGRLFLTNWLFAHAELCTLYGQILKFTTNPDFSIDTHPGLVVMPLVGGGFNFRFSKRGGLLIMFLYNLNYENTADKLPLYRSPVITRIGFFI
jgi:hypothetical protein